MSWNHRVVKTKDDTFMDGSSYAIHEVYYDDDGNVDGMSRNPQPIIAESITDLRWILERMLESLDKEIIENK